MIIKVKVKKGKESPQMLGDVLNVFTNVKRENNQANIDIINQISRYYGVPVSKVRLVSGRRSTNKVFQIDSEE